MEAKKFLDDKQAEHFNKFGVYADTNSKIAEWMEEFAVLSFSREKTTKNNIIKFQEALIQLYETEREGTDKFNIFRDSYKSTIEELKEQL